MVEKTVGARLDQRGETLLELMVSISILGVGVVALVGGIGASVVVSDVHRKEATAGAVARTYAEAIQSGVTTNATDPYIGCAQTSAYSTPANFTAPSGFTATVGTVLYWSTADKRFISTCATDVGVQKVTVTVTSADGRARESLDFIVRKPCVGDVACT
jgi:type II secretory pathway pseudopilin PulG